MSHHDQRDNHEGQWPAPDVVTASKIRPEQVTWLWPGRLPLGKLVVIDGDPSAGKSTLTTDLAARVSTGNLWPDGAEPLPARGMLLLSAEDGGGDTIIPRLIAAGADLDRVHLLRSVPVIGEDGQIRWAFPSLARDIGVLADLFHRYDVALCLVDVLMAYLGKGDAHRDQDVRQLLAPLAAAAQRHQTTVVLVRHLNKSGATSALYRGGGSIGIVGAARAAYLLGRDPNDPTRRILAVTKSNLAPEPPALAYRMVPVPEWGCARIEWEPEPLDGVTAATLLREPADEDERAERDEVIKWFTDHLESQGGEAFTADLRKACIAAGHEWNSARKQLRKIAEPFRTGFAPPRDGWRIKT